MILPLLSRVTHTADFFVWIFVQQKLAKLIPRNLIIFYILQNDETKMTNIFEPLFYFNTVLIEHSNNSIQRLICAILNTFGTIPSIEQSSCNAIYQSLQMTERYTYEQKTTHRCPSTRRDTSCPS